MVDPTARRRAIPRVDFKAVGADDGGVPLRTSAEHEDLRESVQRLEVMIIEQGRQLVEQSREIRTLREQLTRPRNGDSGRSATARIRYPRGMLSASAFRRNGSPVAANLTRSSCV